MARYPIIVLELVNIFVYIWAVTIFLVLFDFSVILVTAENELVLFDVIIAFKNIMIYAFFMVFYAIGILIALISAYLNPELYSFTYNFFNSFFLYFLNLWFPFPTGQAPYLDQVPGLINEELIVLTTDVYLLMFQVLFLFSIISFIRAIYKLDPKFNFYAIGSLIMMIVLRSIIFGFRDMLDLFNVVEFFNSLGLINLNELADPLHPSMNFRPTPDILAFLLSPVAQLAISCYIYLELSFQISYIDTVTKPSLEREERLEAQISLLRKEAVHITANIDKIREEAKQRREELMLEEKESIGKFFTQTGERFSYVKEMIERKKLETEEKSLITAASKTRRLGRYIERLFREDPEAEETITARTSVPRGRNLFTSTFLNFGIRLLILVVVSFVVIHPQFFFQNIFHLPPAIIESVAMNSPEVIIILLIPLMLTFPVIAQIVSYVRHRNLIIRLRQEGKIKEILATVGDYVKVEQEPEVAEEAEEPATVASEVT